MPELPDVTAYVEALEERAVGRPLERLRILSPFVLRTVLPSVADVQGKVVERIHRLGKRIVWTLTDGPVVVVHLMVAGRFHWKPKGAKANRTQTLAVFELPTGEVHLTEASTKKRASIKVLDRAGLAQEDPGGLEVLEATAADFIAALRRENHTLKRSLTDPRTFSGIGNAYSDEILHRARLSPVLWTSRLDDEEAIRLFDATVGTLQEWTHRLRQDFAGAFPEKVTAFREGMAVHGRFGKPCPRCGAPVQRIAYADHETNYCAPCQTGGVLLKDRAMSQLLKGDWPRTLEELEERRAARLERPQ